MAVISDITISMLPSIGVTYHLECAMAVLKHLPFATYSHESTTFQSMVLYSSGIYVKG